MLTRLRVSGFKNLVDVDLRLGPFTCVVGPNGAGKSNLFDSIRFLSALANHTLMEAATAVRDQQSGTAHVRELFHHVGDRYADRMTFVADMVVPGNAVDDLGREAKASITFLRYSLEVAYRDPDDSLGRGAITIVKEELVHIAKRDAAKNLLFPHSAGQWRESVVTGRRSAPYFISTEGDGEKRVITLHQDGGSSRPLRWPASELPRTVLSVANAAESPTVLTARREMESWQLVQLQPSSLRQPDDYLSPTHLGTDGRHLAATLYRLARSAERQESPDGSQSSRLGAVATNGEAERVYSQIANRLAEIMDDVHEIHVDLGRETRDPDAVCEGWRRYPASGACAVGRHTAVSCSVSSGERSYDAGSALPGRAGKWDSSWPDSGDIGAAARYRGGHQGACRQRQSSASGNRQYPLAGSISASPGRERRFRTCERSHGPEWSPVQSCSLSLSVWYLACHSE